MGTLSLDLNTFMAWSYRLNDVPFNKFYEVWSDYLPSYLYILWFLGVIKNFITIPEALLYKLPAILADLATVILIFKIVKDSFSEKSAYVAATAYAFNPAIFANSSMWGQVDSFTGLFALATIYFAQKNWYLSALFLAFGTAFKVQVALAALVVVFIMLRDYWDWKKIGTYVLLAGFIFIALFVPFSNSFNYIGFAKERIMATMNQYPYSSVNAFSWWGYNGFWRQNNTGLMSESNIGYALVILLFAWLSYFYRKTQGGEYLIGSAIFAASFLFFAGMHERHLLFVLPILLVAAFSQNWLFAAYAGFSATYIANLYYAFVWITENFREVFTSGQIKILIIVNLICLLLILREPLASIWATLKEYFKIKQIEIS
jgi:Gpi18-like mannosyltransferase